MMNVRRGIALLGAAAEPGVRQESARTSRSLPGRASGHSLAMVAPSRWSGGIRRPHRGGEHPPLHRESRGVRGGVEEDSGEILRQGTPYVELVAGATCTSRG